MADGSHIMKYFSKEFNVSFRDNLRLCAAIRVLGEKKAYRSDDKRESTAPDWQKKNPAGSY